MRIAIVTAFPRDPALPRGGVEAVSVNLVQALAKKSDLEVHVMTLDRNCSKGEVSQWAGATIHRLPRGNQKLLAYALGEGRRQVQSYLRRLKPDVVHAHDTYGLMVKGLKMPRVFTVHGFIHEDIRYDGRRLPWIRAWLWRWVETAGWANQPHIISISPYVRERLRGIARGVIHDIENPIDENFFSVDRNVSNGTVFSAALICKRKNTLGLLQAIERMKESTPHVRLRLAGKMSDAAYGKSVNEFVHTRQLNDRVTLLGALTSAEVRKELASCAVFALLSFEEGAPMGIAEAMACGAPVVTSNRCGMPYMVRQGETGFLVEPENPEDAAASLRQILEDSELRTRMGRHAREFALERFHPDRVAERTVAVYTAASCANS